MNKSECRRAKAVREGELGLISSAAVLTIPPESTHQKIRPVELASSRSFPSRNPWPLQASTGAPTSSLSTHTLAD